MVDDCIFCKITKKEVPAKILFEDGDLVAFEDIRPQAPVHIIIVPKKHVESVSELEDDDVGLAGKMILAAKNIAAVKGISESGFRIVFNCNRNAGQEVFHLHLHLLGGRKFTWPPG